MNLKYIIIDDELADHHIIKDYAANLPYMQLIKNCYNAFEAMECLNAQKVDLMFLDINMPKLSGFDFLKTLHHRPQVIVTTAYREFALEGYELNVCDYLLKPFGFKRFIAAINKVQEILKKETSLPTENTIQNSPQLIIIKENKTDHQVFIEEIIFVEALGNYIRLQFKATSIISHQTLASLEKQLPSNQFIRIHKSFIVAVDKIKLVEGNQIYIEDQKIPVGKMYRHNVNEFLSRFK
jgi:DNA-binding LytR/AlgR family response regulator